MQNKIKHAIFDFLCHGDETRERRVIRVWSVLMFLRRFAFRILGRIACWHFRQKVLPKLVREKSSKERLTVVFFAINEPMWKFDGLFRLMQKSARFRPIAVPALRPGISESEMRADHDRLMRFFKERGFECFPGRDFEKNIWTDPRALSADIVFYAQPYNGITAPEMRFETIKNSALMCYVPYAFETTCYNWTYNNPYQNFAWKIFLPTALHLTDAHAHSDIRAKNCFATGYPTADDYDGGKATPRDVWKKTFPNCKKIIWAPHHSIGDKEWFGSSTFLEYFEAMFEIAEKYRSRAVFAFKPHPMLLAKLYKLWGEEKTTAYYTRWENFENAFYVAGEYRDLFIESDALIHDCGSFTVEYLYTQKPTMFLFAKNREAEECDFGKIALSVHYDGHSRTDIERFIEDVVLGGNDPKREERERFYEKYLLPPGGQSVAQNILDEIERGLGWKK